MNLFTYLFLGHLVGDFLLQTNWMAVNKAKNWLPLLTHCTVYTLTIIVTAYIGTAPLPAEAITFIFLSHIFLDKRTFVVWWAERIMGIKDKQTAWLIIAADQTFHLLVLGAVVHIWFK